MTLDRKLIIRVPDEKRKLFFRLGEWEYRFWSRIRVGAEDECWPWIPTEESGWIPYFTWNGKKWRCARIIYRLFYGEIPYDHYVCHSCDNPQCLNPDHLWAGTPQQNTWDSVDKGRWHRGGPFPDDCWRNRPKASPDLVDRGALEDPATPSV